MRVLAGQRLKSADILVLGAVDQTPRGLPQVSIDAYVPLTYTAQSMAALVKQNRN